jgi:hypothetical protein
MVKDNLNPNFVKTLDVNFIFEIKQLLKFDVIDVDDEKENSNDFDIIGSCETSVGELFGALN